MTKPKIRKPRAIKTEDKQKELAIIDRELIRLGIVHHWYMSHHYAKKIHKWLGQAILYLEQKEGRKR